MVRNICLYLQEQELLLAADELRLRVLGGEWPDHGMQPHPICLWRCAAC
ncbi:hypothetical protein [Paenibacillus sp. DMB5]|nr:hypothetical protein [Paenibacillus sp. DMB5]